MLGKRVLEQVKLATAGTPGCVGAATTQAPVAGPSLGSGVCAVMVTVALDARLGVGVHVSVNTVGHPSRLSETETLALTRCSVGRPHARQSNAVPAPRAHNSHH